MAFNALRSCNSFLNLYTINLLLKYQIRCGINPGYSWMIIFLFIIKMIGISSHNFDSWPIVLGVARSKSRASAVLSPALCAHPRPASLERSERRKEGFRWTVNRSRNCHDEIGEDSFAIEWWRWRWWRSRPWVNFDQTTIIIVSKCSLSLTRSLSECRLRVDRVIDANCCPPGETRKPDLVTGSPVRCFRRLEKHRTTPGTCASSAARCKSMVLLLTWPKFAPISP